MNCILNIWTKMFLEYFRTTRKCHFMKTLTFETSISDYQKVVGTVPKYTKSNFLLLLKNFDNKKFEETL